MGPDDTHVVGPDDTRVGPDDTHVVGPDDTRVGPDDTHVAEPDDDATRVSVPDRSSNDLVEPPDDAARPPPGAELGPGQVFADFVIDERLGSGQMGVVYRVPAGRCTAPRRSR